jgi:hypothetical protein
VAGDKVEEIDREITAELQDSPGTNRRLIAARNWLGLTFDEKQHLGGVVRRGQRYTVHQGHSCGGGIDVIMKTGYDHTWLVLTQRIIEREFMLSGSDQNPDPTGKNILMLIKHVLTGASAQIEGFKRDGIDFVVKRNLRDLANGMNRITGEPLIDLTSLQREIEARDREIANPFTKDSQITANWGSRKYLGDKLARTAKPHRLLDPKAGLLITVRLNIVTRKTLGGVETIKWGASSGTTTSRYLVSMRLGRWRGSAAKAFTVTEPWKAIFWVAACSVVGWQDAARRPRQFIRNSRPIIPASDS